MTAYEKYKTEVDATVIDENDAIYECVEKVIEADYDIINSYEKLADLITPYGVALIEDITGLIGIEGVLAYLEDRVNNYMCSDDEFSSKYAFPYAKVYMSIVSREIDKKHFPQLYAV